MPWQSSAKFMLILCKVMLKLLKVCLSFSTYWRFTSQIIIIIIIIIIITVKES